MKKRALLKDTFREIKHSIGRFLSIMLIVACGVGVFVGVKATAPSMYKSAEDYFTTQFLYDIELLTTIGFSDEDITQIKTIKELDKVMSAYSVDVLQKVNDYECVVKVMSLAGENEDQVNIPTLIEGRMPENNNECVVCRNDLMENGYEIGDTASFEAKAGATEVSSVLNTTTFEVVGIVEMPQYISYEYGTSSIGNGSVSGVILVNKNVFTYSRYTEVYLTFKCHAEGISAFDDEYDDIMQSVTDQLDEIGLKQYQSFINLNQAEIDAAEAELAAGQAELDAAAQEIADAESQILSGEEELADGEDEYAAASESTRERLQNARTELDNGWAQYNTSKSEYDTAYQTYQESVATMEQAQEAYNQAVSVRDELQAQYDAGKLPFTLSESTWFWIQSNLGLTDEEIEEYKTSLSETTLEAMGIILASVTSVLEETKTSLDEAQAELDASKVELDEAQAQLNQANTTLQSSEVEYAAAKAQAEEELGIARQELDDGAATLAAAREEYYYGLAEYNTQVASAEAELSNGQNRVQNAKLALGEYKSGKWYPLGREDAMINYSGYEQDANRINAIANVFPIFFLLVAVLVSMTTMSRMIDEQRLQIGTYKALGYRNGEIASKYLVYAALAGIIGGLTGPAVCVQVLPRVIFAAYGALYALPSFNINIPWLMFVVSFLVGFLCTVLIAYIACRKELRHQAAVLMRPKAPKAGKKILLERIDLLWKRFGFFQKLTARNLFRNKRRFLMTLIGITGCMALIVAGFGLDNAISPIIEIQYGEISTYDVTACLSKSSSKYDFSATMQALKADRRVDNAMLFHFSDLKATDLSGETTMSDTYLCVPENADNISNYYTLRNAETEEALSLTDNGAIITNKLATELNADIGSEVYINLNEKQYKIKVTGIAENYVYHYVYMSPQYYSKIFEKECSYDVVLMNKTNQLNDQEAFVEDWLTKSDQFSTLYFTSDILSAMDDTFDSLRLVVVVMIVCAALLAFIVLYNLTNINISERIREIATVKVLGFNKKEVNSYVFRENIIMSIISVLIGCFAGYFLAQYIISTVEVSMVAFSREIYFSSYIFAALLTMSFTFFVNLVMTKVIKKISMVESLKAVE